MGEDLDHAVHEGLDELLVLWPAKTRLPVADVIRVAQKGLVVRPDVERHGQREPRVDTGAGRVQCQLPYRDTHAASALIAETQDALVVGCHDQPHVLVARVRQQLRDAVDVVGCEPQAARPTQDVAVFLAGTPHHRRVDDRHELLEVLDQHPIEEGLVSVLERRQTDELLEVINLAPDLLHLERALLLDRHHARGQEPMQSKQVALTFGERGILVQERVLEQLGPPVGDRRERPDAQGPDPGVIDRPLVESGDRHAATTSLAGSFESSSTTSPMTSLASPKSICVLSR